ncbi:MAG: hypothetical protein QM762_14335 [Chryseolinea sp.]
MYTADPLLLESYWKEIETEYSKKDRHYHNLSHLDALIGELLLYREKFSDWSAVVFAIAYHDVVYNTLKTNNEERSAELATLRLSKVSFPVMSLTQCDRLIRATKRHERADFETNLFTDADLSILGADSDRYLTYVNSIRREYSVYPDLLYNPGRKKALRHFLDMERIFKTDEFAAKYEQQARQNIEGELKML